MSSKELDMLRRLFLVVSLAVVTASAAASGRQSSAAGLPPIKRFPTSQAVVDEHLAAINRCDWTRLMAQYPADVEFFLPGGQVVKGRAAVGDLFRNFVKPAKDGGLCGLTFTAEHIF